MLFRPFGVEPNGGKIRDVSGITVKANVEYLEEVISKKNGGDAGRQAIDRLCDSLNARISDPRITSPPNFCKISGTVIPMNSCVTSVSSAS